jgi:outer membrane protein TolC
MRSAASNRVAQATPARRTGVLLALVASLVHAGARAETIALQSLERQALAHRGSVAAARARMAVARARGVAARAPRYPLVAATLSGEVSPGSRLIRVRDLRGDEYLTTGSRALGDEGVLTPDVRHAALVSVEGRLLDFGRTSASVRAADASSGAAAAEAQLEERAVVLDVRLAYLAWLHAFEARRILAAAAQDSRALRESAEARVEEGSERGGTVATTRIDELRSRLALERGETELARARLELELAAASRLPAGAVPDVALLDAAAALEEPGDPEAVVLSQRRSALRAAAAAHRATAFPVVSLAGEVGLRGQAATLFPLYRLGLVVSFPIFDGSAASAAAKVAEAQANELVAQATELGARARARRAQALAEKAHAERESAVARELVAATNAAVRRAEEEQSLGEAGREQLIQARLERARAELDLLAARVERARALLSTAPTRAR